LVFGSSSVSFHFVNVFLHCWLVNRLFLFFRVLRHSVGVTTMSCLLFGLHPLNSESVANCVGRAEILSAHFFLSSIKNRNDSLSSGAFAFFAMMAKEGGIFCLAVLVGLEVFDLLRHRRGSNLANIFNDEFWLFVTSKLMLWMGYLFIFVSLRLWILNGTYPIFTPHDNPGAHAPTKFGHYGTISYYWFVHYWLLFCPKNLAYDWAFGSIPLLDKIFDIRFLSVFSFLIFIGLLAAAVLIRYIFAKRSMCRVVGLSPPMAISVLLLFCPFIPACNLFVTVGFAIAERVMYTPSIGFSLLIAEGRYLCEFGRATIFLYVLGLRRLRGYSNNMKNVSQIFLSITLMLYASKYYIRNDCWSCKEKLFKSGITVHHQNAKMFYNLGNVYRDKKLFHEAKVNCAESFFMKFLIIFCLSNFIFGIFRNFIASRFVLIQSMQRPTIT